MAYPTLRDGNFVIDLLIETFETWLFQSMLRISWTWMRRFCKELELGETCWTLLSIDKSPEAHNSKNLRKKRTRTKTTHLAEEHLKLGQHF